MPVMNTHPHEQNTVFGTFRFSLLSLTLAVPLQGATWFSSQLFEPEVETFQNVRQDIGSSGTQDPVTREDMLGRNDQDFSTNGPVIGGTAGETAVRANSDGSVGALSSADSSYASGFTQTQSNAFSRRKATFVVESSTLAAGTAVTTQLNLSFHGNYAAYAENTLSDNSAFASIFFALTVFDSTSTSNSAYGQHEAATFTAQYQTLLNDGTITDGSGFSPSTLSLYDTSRADGGTPMVSSPGATTIANQDGGFANNGDTLYNAGNDVTVNVTVPLTVYVGQEFGFSYNVSTQARATSNTEGEAFARADALDTATFSFGNLSDPETSLVSTSTLPIPEPSSLLLGSLGIAFLFRRRR